MSIGYIPKKRRITRRLRLLRKRHNRKQKKLQRNNVYIPNVTNVQNGNKNSKLPSTNKKNKFKFKNLFNGIFQIGNQY